MRKTDFCRRSGSRRLSVLLAAVVFAAACVPEPVYADTVDMKALCAGEAKVIQGAFAVVDKEIPSKSSDEKKEADKETKASGDEVIKSSVSSDSASENSVVIKISTASELEELAENSGVEAYTRDKTYMLTDDINMSEHRNFFIPAFFGTFDGDGHMIYGLSYDDEGYSSGLFRYIKQGAVVRNLTVNGYVTVSDNSLITGGICGINEGIISNCTYEGLIKGRNITGAIAAINEIPGTIMACTNKAAVSGYYFTGGICGKNYGVTAYSNNRGTVNNTLDWVEESDKVDPKADKMAAILSGGYHLESEETYERKKGMDTGGIAGYSTGAIYQSENYGSIGYEHTGYNVGGIVGRQAGFVSFCKNSGTVYGRKDVGGIVGQMEPYLTLEDLETLPDAVDKLHDLVETTLDNANASSDIISDDMKLLSEYSKNAVSAGDLLTTTGRNYLNEVGDAADALQARVDYLSDSMPGIIDDLREANSDVSDVADKVRELMEDSSVLDRLSKKDRDDLKKAKDELKDRSIDNLPDRFDALKEIFSIVVPKEIDSMHDAKEDTKEIFEEFDDLSDTLDDTMHDTKKVFEHINGMAKPVVPRLGSDFDYSRELLRLNLDAMTDALSALSDHSGDSSDTLTSNLSDVNDQVNVVFHIISDELDRIGDISKGETDELVRDVSEEEIEAIKQGRVDHCVNKGDIDGDIDIGGICGSMFTDTDDPEENAAGNLDGGFSDKYMLRNIILKCTNDSWINSKKDGAGGIVGYMGHGIVSGCESFGPVTSTEGGYVGGISGQSYSIIRECDAMSYLDGSSYVGGITGYGTTITDCSAFPAFEGRNNRSGSIAGQIDAEKDSHMQHLEVVSENRYVNDTVAGIDYYSMTGVAEPVTYQELVSDNSVSDEFKNILVVFITEDEDEKTEIIGRARLPYGTSMTKLEYPKPEDIEDEDYVKWPKFKESDTLTAPVAIKGQITEVQKSLASGAKYPGTEYPLAFVSGVFTRDDSLSVSIDQPDDETVDYEYTIESDNAGSVVSVRVYNPFDKYQMFGIDADGGEHELESDKKGSYAEYKGKPEYNRLRLREKKSFANKVKSIFGK